MPQVQIVRPTQVLPPEIAASIFALKSSIWPTSSLEESLTRWKSRHSTHCFLVGDETVADVDQGMVLAHALIFKRELLTSHGPLPVGALASVCVHPDYRGYGWGAEVVRAAFSVMPELGVEVTLFQTGVPDFYRKLGARLIPNRFFNGQIPGDQNNPFWEPHLMIYPAAFPWPEGDIDLNGEGF